MDIRLDILKTLENTGHKQRPSTWRKVWVTTIIVVPVMFAAFSVYKFCTYEVIQEMRSLQAPTEQCDANAAEIGGIKRNSAKVNQSNEKSPEADKVKDNQKEVPQSNEIATEQTQNNKANTLEFQAKPIPDETQETIHNLNVLIKDLREHVDELKADKETLKSQIADSNSNTGIYQRLIADMKSQNDQFRSELDLLRGLRTSLQKQRDTMKRQRDELSTTLNGMMRTYGKLNCDVLEMKQKMGQEVWLWVAETGGYCLKDKPPHYWDKDLTDALSEFLANKTVVSFGEGPGYYQLEILAKGKVHNYTSYDASPFYEISGEVGDVKFLDMSVPQYGLPQFDWVVCIEVGQHVPRRYEHVVVENLARHAKEGVVLSWSSHGQGGYSQPNPRSQGYLIEMFDEQSFKLNNEESKHLRDHSKAGWLKRNLQVFRRKDPDSYDPNSV